MFSRVSRNFASRINKRNFNTSSVNDGEVVNGFRQKTAKEIWTGDTGAYPVMGVIAFAVVFCLGTGFYFMASVPDARLSKDKRKAIFRGELQNEK